jgi:tetratricopeptide (TPR) repeat protein
MNYFFGGLDPTGYRLVNLAIHFLSALVVWRVVAATLRLDYFAGRFAGWESALGFASAVVWALHPLTIESVVYVTQRTELLMGLCYLGTLALALRYWSAVDRGAKIGWTVTAALVCAAGMLSKEMMASVPAMILLYERTFLVGNFRTALRRSWSLYVGLAAGWLPLMLLMLSGPATPETGFGLGVPAHVWWLTQAKVIFLYLKLAIWPWPLAIHYHIPYLETWTEGWPWLLAAMSLIIATVVLTWKRSGIGYALSWFFVVLSPTLVVPLVNAVAAERRMYLPLVALVALAMISLGTAWQRIAARFAQIRPRQIVAALAVLLLAGLAAIYVQVDRLRLAAFASERVLWEDTAKYQPDDPLVQVNLGIALVQAGERRQAIEHLSEAVRLDPNSFRAHYNLGRALEAEAQPAEASEHYQQALAINPNHAASHNNLGRLLSGIGLEFEALEHYREALRIDPNLTEAHNNLGILLLQQGFTHQAIQQFEQALALKPDLAAHTNLAGAYARAGRRTEAAKTARAAIALAHAEGNEDLAEALNAALIEMERAP